MQVERDGEAGRDRRGKQSGKSRAREAAYATAAVLEPSDDAPVASKGTIAVVLELRGGRSLARLLDKLSEIERRVRRQRRRRGPDIRLIAR